MKVSFNVFETITFTKYVSCIFLNFSKNKICPKKIRKFEA